MGSVSDLVLYKQGPHEDSFSGGVVLLCLYWTGFP